MRAWGRISDKRGVAPVISTIILSAVVIAIGGMVWSYTQSAATVISSDYFDEVMESVENVKERFYVENIGLDNTSQPTLMVWVFNYGEIGLTVEWIRVQGGGNISSHQFNTSVSDGEMVRFDLPQSEVKFAGGLSVTVEVKSARENKAYGSILIP